MDYLRVMVIVLTVGILSIIVIRNSSSNIISNNISIITIIVINPIGIPEEPLGILEAP